MEDELQAREQAEKVFRLVERECPLSLRRFSRDELWKAVYLGHRQNASTVPILPDNPGSIFGIIFAARVSQATAGT